MTRIQARREPRTRFTLPRAVLLALVLHLLLGLLVTQGGLLMPVEASAMPPEPPLQFRFVDTPETEPPQEPPVTETLSDRDRRAADASPVDEREAPRSEGNTSQELVRLPAPSDAAPPPPPAAQQATPSEARPESPERPEAERSAEQPEPASTTDTGAATAAERTNAEASPPSPPQPEAAAAPPTRPRDLRGSLTQLESFVDPQVFDNPTGGAPDQGSLAQFDTRGYDLGAYLQEVLRRIERHWRQNIPPLIRTGVGGATFVSISIQRQLDGAGEQIARIVIERTWTSGQAAYDSAAQFSLELSSPLPPIPEYYPYETISGRIGFLYNLDRNDVTFPER